MKLINSIQQLLLKSEVREFETGKSIQVSTIYIGLATAYFVDESGKYSGIDPNK